MQCFGIWSWFNLDIQNKHNIAENNNKNNIISFGKISASDQMMKSNLNPKILLYIYWKCVWKNPF